LRVIGEVPAGSVFEGEIKAGEAVRIFTGSPIPKGADHIVIQENVIRSEDRIELTCGNEAPRHIRKAGIDFKSGDSVLQEGCRLGPPEIAVAAAANFNQLPVFAKPRIAVIAAGDELVLPGSAQKQGDIVNSNTSALSALIQVWGGEVTYTRLVKDVTDQIEYMFVQAMTADIIVPVGGASVGDHDHMRRIFTKLGGEMIFEKIAVKPGKPTWFGRLGACPVLGLPGNPASALVCAHLFLRPLMHSPEIKKYRAILAHDLTKNGPKETFIRGKLTTSKSSGQLIATPSPRQDSSLLTPFLNSNILIHREANAAATPKNDLIDILVIAGETLI